MMPELNPIDSSVDESAEAGAVGVLLIAYYLAPQISTPFPLATLIVSVKAGVCSVMAPLATSTDVDIGKSVALFIDVAGQGSITVMLNYFVASLVG